MAYGILLLRWGRGLSVWDGPGCSALCNFCVLLFFVLASRRHHANVRLPETLFWEGVGWAGLPDLWVFCVLAPGHLSPALSPFLYTMHAF